MKQPFFPGQPPDCEIQVRKGGLVCGVAFWPICDSIPLCAKAGKEYAKRTKLYLQWNEVFGGNVEVPVLDFSWGGRRKLLFLLIKIDHGCVGIMSAADPLITLIEAPVLEYRNLPAA
jgi:hypothetical protein